MKITLQRPLGPTIPMSPMQKRCWLQAYGGLLPGEIKFVSSLAQTLRQMPDNLRFIVDESGVPRSVGWIAFGRDEDERGEPCWWIFRAVVQPTNRRRGYCSAAIRAAVAEVPFGNNILASVVPGNRKAATLLRKAGFRRTRRKWANETIYLLRKWRYGK